MRKSVALSTLSIAGALLLSASGCTPPPSVVAPPPPKTSCEQHTDCGDGEICVGGACRPGECVAALEDQCGPDAPADVAPYCCKPWQVCNTLNQCAPCPDCQIGSQCLVSDDCAGIGEFCSGGTCYSTQGRDACTASHQCGAGERCDRTVFLCVPDNGGCTYADQFPELACEQNQLCDVETGFCIDPGDVECEIDDDCREGKQCDALGRCVQCIADDDCGPGTECNEGTGNCISSNRCESDDDCSGIRRCSPATSECVVPECEQDGDCEDNRERCDLTSFTCFLPPAVCDEDDEPNDQAGAATEIPLSGYAGTLCRANTDFLTFPIQANKRYRATVSFPDYNVEGVSVAMMNTSGLITDQEAIRSENRALVTGISGVDETGSFTLRIIGSGTEADLWSYTVTIEETEAPQQIDCSEEMSQGIEPNNTFEEAYVVQTGQPVTFARCGLTDVDYFKVTVPPLHGIEVTVEHSSDEGDLDVYLYDGPSNADQADSSTSSNDVERVESPEGATEFWIKVEKWSSDSDADPNQSYTLTATAIPRPPACDVDINEPDGSIDSAGTLELEMSSSALRCNPYDVDLFEVGVPADRGGQVRIAFNHTEGDLRLDLLGTDGLLITSSNRSTASEGANAFEAVDLPFAATAQTYYARVRIHSGSGIVGQPYSIQATTYDATACTISEPTANDTLNTGQCLGTFETEVACVGPALPSQLPTVDLATCAAAAALTPGCGTVCGAGDQDWYRVGKLNDGQLLRAKLNHDPAGGVLGLALVRMNQNPSEAPNVIIRDFNPDAVAELEVSLTAPTLAPTFAREYAVVVRAEGAGEFSAQPYALEIEVGEPCLRDTYEGESGNNTPARSSLIRPDASPAQPYAADFDATLCGTDTDVYELYAFQGETLTVTLTGVPGMTVNIGTRPDDLGTDAVTIPCGGEGLPLAVGETHPGCSDAGAPDAGDGTRVLATVQNDRAQQLYLTVKSLATNALGSYTLHVDVQ